MSHERHHRYVAASNVSIQQYVARNKSRQNLNRRSRAMKLMDTLKSEMKRADGAMTSYILGDETAADVFIRSVNAKAAR